MRTITRLLAPAIVCLTGSGSLPAQEPGSLKILFLGDDGHHRPADRFAQLRPVLANRGIDLTYSGDVASLETQRLAAYDGLLIYANTTRISEAQEQALLAFVEGGKGLIAVHCASYCFLNSPKYVALVGAQFRSHETGVFRTRIAVADHPVMRGFDGFESWDETYVHARHNDENRTVLAYRDEDGHREPWTWVRTQGDGRVFYTAWGHDERTWGHPGFLNLIERGIRWAVGRDPAVVSAFPGRAGEDPHPNPLPPREREQAGRERESVTAFDAPFSVPEMTPPRTDVEPFAYVDVGAKIPNYTPSAQWGTQGDPFTKMQVPLPAEESIKHIVVPRGFHVELFASEPELAGKPIAMTWDARGRLWVCETYDYPNELQPEGTGRDRIQICEDTDGDWRADKFTVFAEKLSIPSSLIFHRDSVIVQDGRRTLLLKDTDGDDVADERSVLLTGWNMRDTHGGVSNFQYGLDNWVWAMQGYNPSNPSNPEIASRDDPGPQRFAAGFFRFRPAGEQTEFIRSTSNNTWGLGISEEGIIFASTANRVPSVYMPIANRYYERVRGWTPSLVLQSIADTHLFNPITDKVRQVDHHGGYTAGAGHALYTARTYPREYWNRVAFVNGPTGHLTGAFVLESAGSDFRSSNLFNLLASDDEWTAPIMAEVGPDGNVWVIDWYNYIVQHNPTPRGFQTGRGAAYETDLRDKNHGRIYRVVYDTDASVASSGDNAEASSSPSTAASFSLAGATPEQLVQALRRDNMLWRRHAQRLLVERGQRDVLPALFELARDTRVDAIGLNAAAIHALWTMHGLGALDGANEEATAVAISALEHPSAGVRRNAVQVLPPQAASARAILTAGLLDDPNPQVRLASLLALADLPAEQDAGEAIARRVSSGRDSRDPWLSNAAIAAASTNSEAFLHAIAKLETTEGLGETTRIVAEHFARGAPVDAIGPLIAVLRESNPTVAASIVRGLADGWPAEPRPQLSDELESNLERLVERIDEAGRGPLLKLAGTWQSRRLAKYAQQIIADLVAQLDDLSRSERERVLAADRLIEFQVTEAAAVQQLLDRVTPQMPPDLAVGLVDLLRQSESPELGRLLTERFKSFSPSVRATAISVLLGRASATPSLLDALDRGDIQLAELSLDQRQSLSNHPERSLRRRAQRLLDRGGALPSADRQQVVADLLPITETDGDAAAGKVVFQKVCAKCHKHGGEGENIGPDLTGMAVHPKEELLTQIIDPSRSVEGNYRNYSLVTVDGRVLSGMLASESRTAVELFDAEGKKHTLLREQIDELVASNKSVMPDGFEKQISRAELTDLLEFLTQRGRFLPLDLRKVATIASDRGMFNDLGADERLALDDWAPKTVQGVPFQLIDPQDGKVANVILLHGPRGAVSARMPQSVSLPINGPAQTIHLLSGVSGWGFPYSQDETTSMIVRLRYNDGETEEHALLNGVHFADYIRRADVPKSEFAFRLGGKQMRYLAVHPQRAAPVETLEFVKGPDRTAPVVMAVTVETRPRKGPAAGSGG